MKEIFPRVLLQLGPFGLTDTVLVSALLSLALALGGAAALRFRGSREVLEVIYEFLEQMLRGMVAVDARPLIPLVLTQWVFILAANLVGLVPGVASPTRDLSLAAALALIAFAAGHVFALRVEGLAYLRHYIQPNPLLLPFNLIGELSRTIALALRLFGNMLSATLLGAVVIYLAGFLVPVPLMLLTVLTSVVQAYIFGILTLVFSASSARVVAPSTSIPSGGEI